MTLPETIDWNAPWFTTVAAHGPALLLAPDPLAALNTAAVNARLRTASGLPIRFVAAEAANATAYEARIARTGEVPTRANLHDLLNAFVWLAFPEIKARLNALQASVISAEGVGARRGELRDAATLLDENGVLLVSRRADLIDALRQHDWHALFGRYRGAWHTDVRAIVVGHALMEKLMTPYKGICAHALHVSLDADALPRAIDAAVAAALDADLTPKRLLPLPVLGIPGWARNEDPAYYDDPRVFRPLRQPRSRAQRRYLADAA